MRVLGWGGCADVWQLLGGRVKCRMGSTLRRVVSRCSLLRCLCKASCRPPLSYPSSAPLPAPQIVLVNPQLLSLSGNPKLFEEGCLSFPNIYADVEVRKRCCVDAVDARREAAAVCKER